MNIATRPALLGIAIALAACSTGSTQSTDPAADAATLAQGQQTFRFDTFGDETQWSDVLCKRISMRQSARFQRAKWRKRPVSSPYRSQEQRISKSKL